MMKLINKIMADYNYAMFNSCTNKSSKDAMKYFNKALQYEEKNK